MQKRMENTVLETPDLRYSNLFSCTNLSVFITVPHSMTALHKRKESRCVQWPTLHGRNLLVLPEGYAHMKGESNDDVCGKHTA